MATMIRHTYKGKALVIYNETIKNNPDFTLDKYYKYEDKFFYKINKLNYMHILGMNKETINYKKYFYLVDYVLKDNGTFESTRNVTGFLTKEQMRQYIEELTEE